MATAESVKAKLQNLLTLANEATGGTDENLTDAVQTLIAGFGQGGGGTEEAPVPDTSPRIAQYHAGMDKTGAVLTGESYVTCVTEFYDLPEGFQGSVTGCFPCPVGVYDSISNADSCLQLFEGDTFKTYWNTKGTLIRSEGNVDMEGTQTLYWAASWPADRVRFTLVESSLDESYLYFTDTGDILFAGKNTRYYGQTNVFEAENAVKTPIQLLCEGNLETATDEQLQGVTVLKENLFRDDKVITHFQCSTVKEVKASAFYGANHLKTFDAPQVDTFTGLYIFRNSGVEEFVNDRATTLNQSMFESCASLRKVDMRGKLSTISRWALWNTVALETLIIRRTDAVPVMQTTETFGTSAIANGTGYIYVPAALVEEYKAATNWSTYADRIRAIEDYPDITGG